jgi:hypothetical protein
MLSAAQSDAGISMTLTSGIANVSLTDDDNDGSIIWYGSCDAWSFNVSTGLVTIPSISPDYNPDTDSISLRDVELASTNQAGPNSSPLTIVFTSDDVQAPPSPFLLEGTLGSHLPADSTLWVEQKVIWEGGSVAVTHNTGPGDYGEVKTTTGLWTAPGFKVQETVILTAGASGGTFSFDLISRVIVPEPSTLAMLLTLTLGCLLGWRCRFKL